MARMAHLRFLASLGMAWAVLGLPVDAQVVGPPTPKTPPAAQDKPKEAFKDGLKNLFKKLEDKSAQAKTSTEEAEKPAEEVKKPAPAPARPPMLTQPEPINAKVEAPQVSEENPPVKLVTLDNPANPLGIASAQAKLNQAAALIDQKNWVQARLSLTPTRQWLIDCTEAHLNLYKTLNNIPTARAQAELEKQLALQFALLRDRAMYEMGRLQVAEHNLQAAVKELTEVVKSQPRSNLGLKAYKILQEIGFTEKLQLAE